jgi:hypothetical protein
MTFDTAATAFVVVACAVAAYFVVAALFHLYPHTGELAYLF